jgi:hypothetical protein
MACQGKWGTTEGLWNYANDSWCVVQTFEFVGHAHRSPNYLDDDYDPTFLEEIEANGCACYFLIVFFFAKKSIIVN